MLRPQTSTPHLTSWTFLLALLDLLPLGELVKRLGSLLQFGDEELDVVQDAVQDLLQREVCFTFTSLMIKLKQTEQRSVFLSAQLYLCKQIFLKAS